MNELGIQDRAKVFDRTVNMVESKHFNPQFDKRGWRQITADRRDALLQAGSRAEFEEGLSALIRNVGPPDCGLIHESERRKVPKGIAARFQYCEPAQCALGVTQPSPGGDVMISRLDGRIGWLRVTKFPGAVGIDIAKKIDEGIAGLKGCDRLIVDLRGNSGGGLAFLRVMSYLTPDRVPVGYSVTRARAETGYSRDSLAVFDRIPSRKVMLAWLALKFGIRDDSVSIFTEGLGPRPFHQRIVLLTDGETTGAGERIAAFARERSLAPIVGTQTAGRLICCSTYKVGHGYFVRLPARAWYTWAGELLENKGVAPDYTVPSPSAQGDPQMQKARELAAAL